MTGAPVVFGPDVHPVEVLGSRYRGNAVASELMTWRGAFQWLVDAGSERWWAKVSSSFAAKMLLFAECRNEALRSTVSGVGTGDRVLDVACGPGSTSRFLADCGAGDVVGIDVDRAVLELARSGPSRPSVSFQLVDVRTTLPFPDNSFDVAHLGDFYDLTPIPELRRVVRSGGRIIVRSSGVAAGVVYSHDRAFDLRIRAASEQGMADRFGDVGPNSVSWAGQLAAAGLAPPSTIAVDWLAPIEPLAATWQLHNAALWTAGLARPHLSDSDWNQFVDAWNPDNPEALLRRADMHIVHAVSWSDTVIGSA